ncbi:helix-turn-helix domain-containing protein [Terrabacter sp. Root181]|uniref:helix-turn-helix domain-containing protein n=1 Tax=Terrabacter sp. Root181 TaxID=1736484 RepID=UPI0006F2EA39|nr:helix-turn-helix domain-containing protein [Terrabacter sp. Root181]KRB47587.1 hypothetical protein ASD90_04450 [Terrabacter sp. Root181]
MAKPTRRSPAGSTLTADEFRAARDWPTALEIAEEYGVNVRWVHDMLRERRFRAVRINVLRIDPDDFVRFLNDLNAAYLGAKN